MFLGFVVILVVIVALVWDAIGDAGKQELSSILQKIIVNFLQVVSLCSAFPLRWPPALEKMFEVQGAISTLGEHLVNPDCVTSSSTAAELYYSKQLFFAMLPVFVALFSFLFWYAVGKKRDTSFFAKRTNDEKNTPKDNFVVTMTSVLYLLYPTICKHSFGLFDCKKIGDTWYLRADLEEECYTGSHAQAVFSLGVTQFLLYVMGLPLIVFLFLHRNQDKLTSRVVLARYGLFYAGYKSTRFFWEVIITARKVAIVALSVFGPALGPQKQAQVALLVLLVCIVCEIYGDPFLEKDASYKILAQLEVCSLIVPWLTMWSGLVIYELAEKSPIAVLLSFVVISANGVLMLFSMLKFIQLKLVERRRKKLKAEEAEKETEEETAAVVAAAAAAAEEEGKFSGPNNPAFSPSTRSTSATENNGERKNGEQLVSSSSSMLSHHGGKLLTSFTKQNTAPAVKDVTIEMIELPVTDDENTTQKSKEIHVIPKARVSNWVDENNSGDSSVSTDDVYVDENSGRRYSVTELGVSVWVDDT